LSLLSFLSYPGLAMLPFAKMMRLLPSSFTPYSVWMRNQRSCLSAFQLHCLLGLNVGTTASFSDTASPKKGKRAPLQVHFLRFFTPFSFNFFVFWFSPNLESACGGA
jgi:hypothetical protein